MNRTEALEYADVMPEFDGDLSSWLLRNVKYNWDKDYCAEHRIVCEFIVDTSGAINKITVSRSSGSARYDQYMLKVIGSMPKWKPGKNKGKAVAIKFSLPIQICFH